MCQRNIKSFFRLVFIEPFTLSYNLFLYLLLFSVYRKVLTMKMGPILTFLIILINNLEKSEARAASFIGTLTPMKNGLSGEIHSTDDEMFLEIKNFTYDGKYITFFFSK